MAGKNKLSGNWIDFLHNSVNKQQLFQFLSHKLRVYIGGKHIFTTVGTLVASAGATGCDTTPTFFGKGKVSIGCL